MAAVAEESGAIRLTETRTASDVSKGFTRFQTGDVLFAKITPCMENGKIAIVPAVPGGVAAGSTEFHVIRPDVLRPHFVFFYLVRRALREDARRNMSGSAGQLRVPTDYLRTLPIPVPPLEVQDQLVGRVEELFVEIDDGEAALADARAGVETYRKALLKSAVTGELTADWRRENPPTETGGDLLHRILTDRRATWSRDPQRRGKAYVEPKRPTIDQPPDLPEGWAWLSLAEIVSTQERSFQSGPFGSSLLHSEFQASGKLVIGIDNVRDGFFSLGSNHRISPEKFDQLIKYKARPRDIVITVMATIGRTCVIPDDIEDAIITKHLYRMSPSTNVVLPMFVNLCLRGHPVTLAEIFGNTQGQTRPGLNKEILEGIPIPVPPLLEQEMIIRRHQLSAQDADEGTAIIESQSAATAALRQSILSAAFRGELV